MKKYFFPTLMSFALLLSGFRAADTWVLYKSVPGHFSVLFPGKAQESDEDEKTEDGKTFKMHMATYPVSDNEVYMVGWIDMTAFYPDKSMKQMLEDSRDGATGAMGMTDVKTLATKVTGEPYIEFTFAGKDLVGKERIYVINKFQYSVITIFGKSGIRPEADKFLTSFRYIR